MSHIIGKVYNEDAKEHIKVTPKKNLRIQDGMYVFRKGYTYDAIKDQHNNISIDAFGQHFNFDSEATTLCFKTVNKCICCGKPTIDIICDKCKFISLSEYVDSENNFN